MHTHFLKRRSIEGRSSVEVVGTQYCVESSELSPSQRESCRWDPECIHMCSCIDTKHTTIPVYSGTCCQHTVRICFIDTVVCACVRVCVWHVYKHVLKRTLCYSKYTEYTFSDLISVSICIHRACLDTCKGFHILNQFCLHAFSCLPQRYTDADATQATILSLLKATTGYAYTDMLLSRRKHVCTPYMYRMRYRCVLCDTGDISFTLQAN